jgi:hypothetical protein
LDSGYEPDTRCRRFIVAARAFHPQIAQIAPIEDFEKKGFTTENMRRPPWAAGENTNCGMEKRGEGVAMEILEYSVCYSDPGFA